MVEQTDSNENNEVSAEAVYQRYQKARPVSNGVPSDAIESSELLDEDDLAGSLYRRYQQNRATQSEAAIQGIQQSIDEQTVEKLLQQDDQPMISAGAPDIQSIDVQNGQVNADLQSKGSAANSPSVFKRLIMPSIAAAILGIVVIPLVMNTSSAPATLQATIPTALTEQAVQAVAFIDAPASNAFGFSDGKNAAKMAFNNGVSITDLHLLIEAKQSAAAGPFLKTLVSPADTHAATQRMTAAIVDGASDDTLQTQLKELTLEVEHASREAKQLDWYLVGRSVESIKVAAEYALEYSETQSLEQALMLGAELNQPTDAPNVSTLLGELFSSQLTAPDEFVQASKILTTANDIKLLMQ